MSRKPRFYGETGIYHIILRGNNYQNIFYDDEDRKVFINRLRKYVKIKQIELYAFCLMDNHVHLLIGNGNDFMPDFIKRLLCSYVYYFNHKYERCGHLFQGRYKSEAVENVEYFKTVYRYILQNPEKARICAWKNYKWSSYFLKNKKYSFLNEEYVLSIFEGKTVLESFLTYDNSDLCMEYYTDSINYLYYDELKIQLIKKLFKIQKIQDFIQFEPEDRKSKIKFLKKIGFSVNQISRITGIERLIVKKA